MKDRANKSSRFDRWLAARLPAGFRPRTEIWKNLALIAGASVIYLIWFIEEYVSRHSKLYSWEGGDLILIPGTVMDDFGECIQHIRWVVAAIVLWALIQGVNFCLYHIQKSKSIYLMRRLPDRWELTRRCWSLTLMMVGLALVTYGLLLGVSWGLYVLFTPPECMTEGQWYRLWTVWKGGFLWLK